MSNQNEKARDRMRRFTKKKKAAGFIRIFVWVDKSRASELRDIVRAIDAQPDKIKAIQGMLDK